MRITVTSAITSKLFPVDDGVRDAASPTSRSGPNNLLVRGQTVTAETQGALMTLRTCYGYDVQGRRISETQPLANLASCP